MDLIGVVVLTGLAAYLWGTGRAGLSAAGLRAATIATLETVGLGVLFLAANVGLSLCGILVGRAWTGWFVPVYALDYITLGGVSLLQGLLCRWWRDRG